MTRLVLDLNKSIEENASDYYDKAKKIKKKVSGAEEALKASLDKLEKLEREKRQSETAEESQRNAKSRKKEWYEKFRWFLSSDGFLIIGGRDATSNEILIKKHTDKSDIVLHTDMAGSPFFVIKSENKKIPNSTLQEAADAACTFSKAWKLGLQTTEVFYVKPEQISKKTKSGEFMGKGAFMIYGKTNYIDNKTNLSIGITENNAVMAGPLKAIKRHCKKFITLTQGDEKVSTIAKKINRNLGGNLDLDEIIRSLPAGTFKVR